MHRQNIPQPAIFYDVDGTHRTDTCENLKRLTELLSHNEQVVWQSNPQSEKCFEKIAEYVQVETPMTVQSRLMLDINELLIEVYESSQYFATSFKRKTGQSPSTFRQRAS